MSDPSAMPITTHGAMRRTIWRVASQASRTRCSIVGRISMAGPAWISYDVRLHEPLEVKPGDDESRTDGHEEAGDQVGHRDLRTEEAPEQDEGDLVDHRCRDEEGERDPERHAGFDEADEERHRRAGAERGDDPE